MMGKRVKAIIWVTWKWGSIVWVSADGLMVGVEREDGGGTVYRFLDELVWEEHISKETF